MSESVAILMPKISEADYERFKIRYSGLEQKLGLHGLTAAFAHSHESYDSDLHSFNGMTSAGMEPIEDTSPEDVQVVRDLTMPKDYDKPLYNDSQAPLLVHQPELNQFLSRKDLVYEAMPDLHPLSFVADSADIEEAAAAILGHRLLIKPLTGSNSSNVKVIRKKDLARFPKSGTYLVQEYVDTTEGDPNLDIDGTHNLRLISIGSQVVGAITRVGGKKKNILIEDEYGVVFEPERLPEEVHTIAKSVHEKLSALPGDGKNVIAIDVMYGKTKSKNRAYTVCEINRRPLRISNYDLTDPQHDPEGIMWLGNEWDRHEAKMLADLVKREAA